MAQTAARENGQSWNRRLEGFFRVRERGSTLRAEVLAGATTFMVSAYIIFVNPAILSFSGIPDLQGLGPGFAPTLAATCLITALLTLAYGLWTNYPFLIAPGMGLNAVVAFQLIAGHGLAWQEAMGVIFLEGLAIFVLVLTGLREAIMEAIPASLKKAIGVGIGLFILIIGAVNGGLIQMSGVPSAPLALGDYTNVPALVTFVGLGLTVGLFVRKVKGALLLGIALTTAVAIGLNALSGWTAYTTPGVAVVPTSIANVPDLSSLGAPLSIVDGQVALVGLFVKLGLVAAVLTIFSLMLSDFFDTMGTIVGIGSEAGFLDQEGRYPKGDLRKILAVDSLGAMLGGLFGSSSATTYIESAAGVSEGGRTGLAAVVAGLLFAAAIFFAPLAGVIPPQATAPALILVGLFMCAVIGDINWRDPEQALPALATMTLMPYSYSITNGIGWGFILHTFIKAVRGKGGEVHWMMWAASGAFVIYFALPWLQATLGI